MKKKKGKVMWEDGKSTVRADAIHSAPEANARVRVTPFNSQYEEALREKGTLSGFRYFSAFYTWYVKQLLFVNKRYTKWVPFLSRVACKRARG